MSNQLEKFINNNRDEFDSEKMKIDWEKIKSGVTQKKTKFRRLWWAAAASITLVISTMVYFNHHENKPVVTAIQAVDLPPKELTDQLDRTYTSQMDQFAILIEHKQNELRQNQKTQPELYKQFLNDNNRLDSSYKFLKSELSANPNKEILLDAMIQNLELKLDLLNRQLQIIKQSKNKKTNNENKTI